MPIIHKTLKCGCKVEDSDIFFPMRTIEKECDKHHKERIKRIEDYMKKRTQK